MKPVILPIQAMKSSAHFFNQAGAGHDSESRLSNQLPAAQAVPWTMSFCTSGVLSAFAS